MSLGRRAYECGGSESGYIEAKTLTPPPEPDALAEALDCGLTFTTGGDSGGWTTEGGSWCYHNWDQANGTTCDGGTDWMQTTVTGAGTLKFWWMVSSEGMCDQLEFYIDGQLQDDISGDFYNQWTQKSYTVGAGTHTFRWQYTKNDANSVGYDRGWVDWVQWSGTMTEPATTAWSTLNYVYDAAGRRIEKQYDGRTVLKYLYDGDHCIAEYGAGNDLHRKYVYGPGVDQPICMIESTGTYAGTYYYHFDGLGSVIALTSGNTGSMGNTVQTYDYDVYGRVGALDASHPNRLMFTGREFDKETGLYYYRARHYKPEIGRFLQTDPVGYDDGMNLYAYCGNNPGNLVDPLGTQTQPGFFGKDWLDVFGNPCEPNGVPVWTDVGIVTIITNETDVVWGKWQHRDHRGFFTGKRWRNFWRDGTQTRQVTKYQVYELRCLYSDGRPYSVQKTEWIQLESWTETRSWHQQGAIRWDAQGYVDFVSELETTHGAWKVVEQPIKK